MKLWCYTSIRLLNMCRVINSSVPFMMMLELKKLLNTARWWNCLWHSLSSNKCASPSFWLIHMRSSFKITISFRLLHKMTIYEKCKLHLPICLASNERQTYWLINLFSTRVKVYGNREAVFTYTVLFTYISKGLLGPSKEFYMHI